MANMLINSSLGSALTTMLTTNDDIVPGYAPSYELCKNIYLFHPLGAKIVEKPLEIALAEAREISVPNSPESRVVEAFEAEWQRLRVDGHIENVMRQARIYGIASIALMEENVRVSKPVDYPSLYRRNVSFNTFDPMNTAGSLVLNQDPLAMDFQHTTEICVSGESFHRSRSITMLNESPIFISFTHSAFGFVGRSVYQRSLFPLRSFIQTMIADDMVARKAAVLVAKMKQAGSVVNNAMHKMFGIKRAIVKEAENGNVIGISPDEDVVSLNFQNLDGPMGLVRENIIKNIASASRMPAKLLTEETFAEGFGEGSEDAKAIAHYIDGVRDEMQPLFEFFDKIVQHRAWNPEFFKTVQRDYPNEYGKQTYEQAFYTWRNSFDAKWPSLLKEPDSELVKVDEVKLKAVISWVTTLLPILDSANKATVIEWATDNFNALKFLFDSPLVLDYEAIAAEAEEQKEQQKQQAQAGMMQPGGGMPGQPGAKPGMPGQGGPPKPAGGMGMSLGGASAHDAADPVIQFQQAVARMLEGKAKASGKR